MRALVLLFTLAGALCAAAPPLALLTNFENPPSPDALKAMREELARILGPAGLSLQWSGQEEAKQAAVLPRFLLLSFKGVCAAGEDAERAEISSKLGASEMSDGRVLPFARVECDGIRDVVADTRDRTLGVAMARVVAHEIYHVLMQTSKHAKAGIGKARHTKRDLTAAGIRFDAESERELRAAMSGELISRR